MNFKHIFTIAFLLLTCNLNAQTNISGIINDYTAVTSVSSFCPAIIQVSNAAGFSTGDTVLIIQMQGCKIDSSNTPAFGTITNYASAGNYEFTRITFINGNNLTLNGLLKNTYDVSGYVQLIRVPAYYNAAVSGTLTAQQWNGSTGGILVFNVLHNLVLNADIDVSGKGFAAGQSNFNGGFLCAQLDYYYPGTSTNGVNKGQGIYEYSSTISRGRGAAANAGGGGNNHNAGGGGGSNYGNGGAGGREWSGCGNSNFNGGVGGYALNYSNALNKIFMGGGGGAGHNNLTGINTPGGKGGGIIIIHADSIAGNSFNIKANGDSAINPVYSTAEGRGGGGAGGTVLFDVQNYSGSLTVETKGGGGGNLNNFDQAGPGGGGGGGVTWFSTAAKPVAVTTVLTGGPAGVNNFNGSTYGNTDGFPGGELYNLIPVETDTSVMPVINLGNDTTLCNGDTLLLTATFSNAVYLWQDGSANSVFSVTQQGIYWVDVTLNNCTFTDSIHVNYINCGTGISEPGASGREFVLYPNPAQGILYIVYNFEHRAADFELKISDASGRVAYQSAIHLSPEDIKSAIDVSHLPGGIYFLQLTSGGRQVHAKFVIQRRQ